MGYKIQNSVAESVKNYLYSVFSPSPQCEKIGQNTVNDGKNAACCLGMGGVCADPEKIQAVGPRPCMMTCAPAQRGMRQQVPTPKTTEPSSSQTTRKWKRQILWFQELMQLPWHLSGLFLGAGPIMQTSK
uniref:Uncharacterized protein n=1 Tax=Eutreptiella gymnastica TaxID=73025 RepID=A0A7S4LFG6_9EUGL|mmetsp:Transcript_76791/g.128018  ORF Transcript_76791/g.128018 Transcript_76791/m.128018 type:complete len:130 (+) Transcript_76791:273-662(+)